MRNKCWSSSSVRLGVTPEFWMSPVSRGLGVSDVEVRRPARTVPVFVRVDRDGPDLDVPRTCEVRSERSPETGDGT